MIRDIFEKILFMGSQAVPVIVIVFALRILLYRFHKKYLYFLWLLVAVRLVVPVSITSPMSMLRLFESIPMPGQSTVVTEKEQLSEVPAGRTTIKEKPTSGNEKQTERIKSDATGDFFVTNAGNNSDWENIWQIFLYVWFAGMAVFLVWNFFSFIQMQRRTKKAVRLEDNIWECENISSPLLWGYFDRKFIFLSDCRRKKKILFCVMKNITLQEKTIGFNYLPFSLCASIGFIRLSGFRILP